MQQASTTALPDQTSIQYPQRAPSTPTATVSRLRTVTGNRFPRKCACGCGHSIPRDAEVRYVVDFGAAKPYPAYLREHSPDYGTYHGKPRAREDARSLPGFTPASELPRPPSPTKPPAAPRPTIEVAHEDAEATASPEGGPPLGLRAARLQRGPVRVRAQRVRGLREGWRDGRAAPDPREPDNPRGPRAEGARAPGAPREAPGQGGGRIVRGCGRARAAHVKLAMAHPAFTAAVGAWNDCT